MKAICKIHFGDLNQTIHVLNEEDDIVNTYKVRTSDLSKFFSKQKIEEAELMGPLSFCKKIGNLANEQRKSMYEDLTPIKFIYTREGEKE